MRKDPFQSLTTDLAVEGAVATVTLEGDLGVHAQEKLQEIFDRAVGETGCRAVVIDLSHVTHIASFAVAAIGFYYKQLNDRGGLLALAIANDQLVKPFRLAGLEQIVPIFPSARAARAALAAQRLD